MDGFDPEFVSPEDYILQITARIWEGRDIGAIRRYYARDCIMRTPMRLTTDVDAVVRGTLETLHVFPDRRLLGEDVLWVADPGGGFHSSHRIISPARHLGDGAFGPPSGRAVRMRTIADCACRDNRVYEEWLVRDQAAIVAQTGADPRAFAFEEVAREVAAGRTPGVFKPEDDVAGVYRAPTAATDEARAYADLLGAIWCDKDLSRVQGTYDEAVTLELPGGRREYGRAGADRFWLGYLAALPEASFTIDHLSGRTDPGRAARAAARWSIRGAHAGHGAFGAPSGADVYVLGISHAEIVAGRVVREWVVVDEIAVWRQIAIAEG